LAWIKRRKHVIPANAPCLDSRFRRNDQQSRAC
jgi:hypothetical protein